MSLSQDVIEAQMNIDVNAFDGSNAIDESEYQDVEVKELAYIQEVLSKDLVKYSMEGSDVKVIIANSFQEVVPATAIGKVVKDKYKMGPGAKPNHFQVKGAIVEILYDKYKKLLSYVTREKRKFES